MKLFIYGGSGSGKSAYAEKRAANLSKNRIYLATMKVFDEEDEERVNKHRNMRRELSFDTVEMPVDISNALNSYYDGVVLVECISNLVANEMFKDGKTYSSKDVAEKIIEDINIIFQKAKNIVIVSNNIFEDGIEYDDYTKEYLKALGNINTHLSSFCDEVVEVVVGIPVEIKKYEKNN